MLYYNEFLDKINSYIDRKDLISFDFVMRDLGFQYIELPYFYKDYTYHSDDLYIDIKVENIIVKDGKEYGTNNIKCSVMSSRNSDRSTEMNIPIQECLLNHINDILKFIIDSIEFL